MSTYRRTMRSERGIALITALLFMVILYPLSAIFLSQVVHENKMARFERDNSKAFYASHGAGQMGIEQLDVLINTYLKNTISSANPSGVISYAQSQVNAGDGIGWIAYSVRNNNVAVLSLNGEQAEYTQSGTLDGTAYSYAIVITEKSDPTSVGSQAWDFPYSYRIESTGTAEAVSENVVISGDFTVRVQKDNFAKFALFTNTQTTPSGSNVWFTSNTNFAGPVHTNGRFNFAFNPSGTFQEAIDQVQTTARFYNSGSSVLLNANANGSIDVPVFNGGFTRGVSSVTLNTSTQQTDMVNEAQGNGGGNFDNNGIYIPANGSNLSGGIYVKGDSTIVMSVDGSGHAVYNITQGASTRQITVNESASQTQVYDPSNGSTTTYSGIPDGADDAGTLIFIDGTIDGLSGTVQSGTQVTVGSSSDIVVTDHIRYADYTAGSGTPGTAGYVPPSAEGTVNLLGIVSWNGNVRVATGAPSNVEIHGTIMAMNGVFQVDNYDQGSARGTATLLGGVISDDYGAFGQFDSSTGQPIHGYGRNFVYDQRMQQGSIPPYFPSLNTFIAFTNDITDKMIWQEGD